MTADSAGPSDAGVHILPAAPNNLGPTLLIALGLLTVPLLIGVPLLILGLSRVRSLDGTPALPSLARTMTHLGRVCLRS